MKKVVGLFLVLLAAGLVSAHEARADVTLLDKDDWKVNFSGFVEFDAFSDSVRSFTEVVGSNPVDRPDTANGMSGRTQFSMRNSRLAFGVLPPKMGNWKTRAYLEMDFLGYDPSINADATKGATNSEGSYYTNPTLRMRHGYFAGENGPWQILVGQTWSLIGWQSQYVLSTVSVAPVTGTLYERTPQITLFNKTDMGQSSQLRSGFSIVRPPQKDAEVPELDAAVQYNFNGMKAAFTSTNGDVKANPLSVALSGSLRQFVIPKAGDSTGGNDHYLSSMFALDTFIPILTASGDKEIGNTLGLSGEFTQGKGYADEFPGWTGNTPQLSSTALNPNMDAGQGGFDPSSNFRLVDLRTWNAQLQYHLPADCAAFTTLGYGQLYSDNVDGLAPSSGKVIYNRTEVYLINFVKDLTKQVRVGLEFDHFRTSYTDGVAPSDNRIQLSSWFRF